LSVFESTLLRLQHGTRYFNVIIVGQLKARLQLKVSSEKEIRCPGRYLSVQISSR
jgi:hypothetical protein